MELLKLSGSTRLNYLIAVRPEPVEGYGMEVSSIKFSKWNHPYRFFWTARNTDATSSAKLNIKEDFSRFPH